MLPTTFGNTLWFSDDELQELRGTTLYRATELQVICHFTHFFIPFTSLITIVLFLSI